MPGGINPPTTGKRVVVKAVGGGVPDAPRGVPPPLQATLKGVRRAACPQAAAGVSGWLPVDGRPRKARRDPSGLASSASPSGPDPSVAPRHLPAQRGVTPKRGAFCAGEARGIMRPLNTTGVRGRLAAHNERRQFATQTRSCGCLPRRGKHCSLPSFAALNCGPVLATPQHPNFKTEEGSAALRTDSNTASV